MASITPGAGGPIDPRASTAAHCTPGLRSWTAFRSAGTAELASMPMLPKAVAAHSRTKTVSSPDSIAIRVGTDSRAAGPMRDRARSMDLRSSIAWP